MSEKMDLAAAQAQGLAALALVGAMLVQAVRDGTTTLAEAGALFAEAERLVRDAPVQLHQTGAVDLAVSALRGFNDAVARSVN